MADQFMPCPKCGWRSLVKDTNHKPDTTKRARDCEVCGHRFYTVEYVVSSRKNEISRRKAGA